MNAPRSIGRFRYRWWRLAGRHISGWLDRRWEAAHPFPIKLGCGPFSPPEDLWHECRIYKDALDAIREAAGSEGDK